MSVQHTFPIQGMTCGNCAQHVQKALQALPGISHVQIDLDNHQAAVEYDAAVVTVETMANAVKEAGYTIEIPH